MAGCIALTVPLKARQNASGKPREQDALRGTLPKLSGSRATRNAGTKVRPNPSRNAAYSKLDRRVVHFPPPRSLKCRETVVPLVLKCAEKGGLSRYLLEESDQRKVNVGTPCFQFADFLQRLHW